MQNKDYHWYFRSSEGEVFGPVSFEQLHAWKEQGRLNGNSEVSCSYPAAWRPAMEAVPEFFSAPPKMPVGGPILPQRANWLITLAILGFLCVCPVFSISAWIMASADLREMNTGQRDSAGRSSTLLAYRIGLVAATIWISFAILGFLLAMQRAAQIE